MSRPLRFTTFLAPNMLPVYRYIAEYAGERLGCRTELFTGTSFDEFERGEADVGFLCGLPYVQLARRPSAPVELHAAPVLAGERYGGQPIYYSDVIVRRDSPFQSFSDLRGRIWSYNDPDSHSGYNVTRYELVRMGETRGYFREVVRAGWHQRSIQLVAAGTVDGSAIDSQVLTTELRDNPDLAERLRVIHTLGPAAIQPVVAAARLSPSLKSELRAVLIDMSRDPVARERLEWGCVERFVAVNDSNYDDIRGMLTAAESAGFLTIK